MGIEQKTLSDKGGNPTGHLVTLPNRDVQAYDANGHYMGFARWRDQVTFDRYWQYMAKEFRPSILIERVRAESVRDASGKAIARLVTLATGNVQVYTMEGRYQGMAEAASGWVRAADGRRLAKSCDPMILVYLRNPVISPHPVAWRNYGQQSLFEPPSSETSSDVCESGVKTLNGIWYYSAEPEKVAAILKDGWEPRLEQDLMFGTGIYLSHREHVERPDCIQCELAVEPQGEIHQFPSKYACGCDSHSFFCHLWEMGLHVRLRSEPGMAPENRAIAAHFLGRGCQAAHICLLPGFPTVVVYDPSIIVKVRRCLTAD